MPISVNALTKTDYDVLEYINKFSSVSKEQLIGHFPKIEALEYRLSELTSPDYCENKPLIPATSNSKYIAEEYKEYDVNGSIRFESKNSYHITDLGKKALQDYRIKNKIDSRDFWRKSILTPILVTLATNLAIHAAEWLWPLIQELLRHTP